MISRELLSEVLGTKTIQMNPILENNNMVGYLVYGSQDTITQIRSNHKQINIYELAHKCKEWASKLGFHLTSHTISYEAVLSKGYCQTHHVHHIDRESDKPFRGLTEPEAIFKACQWILDNKEIK